MSFAGKVWRLLVGIKDGLSLLFLLLFFGTLFALLSARPSPGQVREGALLLELDGYVVEERSEVDPLEALLAAETQLAEYPARDLARALDAAASDDRIKAVVLDLSKFMGGGQVHLQEVAEALDRVRAADKPVLAYALAYGDDAMMLAAHASEVWVDPLGGAVITGPGGTHLYYADLFEKLGVTAHIYRVGTFKSAVEPYSRNSMSDEARENYAALYGALWEEWQANVKKARPALELSRVTTDPVTWIKDSGGDLAKAAQDAGLVDKLGSRVEFGQRVAEIAGQDDWSDDPGAFAATDLAPWLADNPAASHGKPIGVITIAGELVDGDAGPGIAGGNRIAGLLDDALEDDLAALVVRVDSPGGSILASEEVRRAILRHKAKGIPIAVSMANLAASGGYWVSTPADRIFAQPETITGSIGVFGVLPSFEGAAAKLGINADGYRTTALSGQPDLVAGFSPEVDAILQASVESNYAKFLGIVAKSRGKSAQEIDTIAQGRVWDGGSARQLGLVDQFGGLDDALAWAAKQAKLEDGKWHARFLGSKVSNYDSLIRRLVASDAREAHAAQDLFGQIAGQQAQMGRMLAQDVERLMGARGVQVYCLECPRVGHATPRANPAGLMSLLTTLTRP
ncbi:signal peptide peptidase SppA [Erythrobacteraceae bacterium E2-1 Yellow Sea]|nr:signal peptide peptidase SppA [Erythrobacteraceae bacterium E2-1 Yellow Sea]